MEKYPLMGKCLAVGIILLFVGTCIVPAIAQDTEKPLPASRGNWLYVGGSGPGNYTRIQDAIDNASDEDVVFVFDDSSPYVENIVINTSISLIGENKYTTIVDGANISDCVNITTDKVRITGFTIKNGYESGIIINSNGNTIIENILSDNPFGIYSKSTGFNASFQSFQNNTITNNSIQCNGGGIVFLSGKNIVITGNVISESYIGIALWWVMNSNVSFNIVSENEVGIWIMIAYNTMIYRNNISYNHNIGLFIVGTNAGKILQNNFIGNNRSAISSQWFPLEIKLWKEHGLPIFRRNVWRGNYWDEPRSLPYMIPGIILKLRFHFDWFPAQEPYDIPRMT